MKSSFPDNVEFDALLDELIFEQLSSEKISKLEQILSSDERAFDHYRRSIGLHAMLSELSTRVAAKDLNDTESLSSRDAVRPTSQLVRSATGLRWTKTRSSTALFFVGLAASLVVVSYFAALASMVVWDLMHRKVTPDQIATLDPESQVAATVTAAVDVKWSKDVPSKPLDEAIHPGEPLSIDAGLVELRLKQGATLLVEGPSQWSIDGDNRATLKQGKLVAKVPQQAIGFAVDTPSAHIVDLGTEFGVEVKANRSSQVTVLEGKVESRSIAAGGKSLLLYAGQTARLSASNPNPEVVLYDPQSFAALKNRSRTDSEANKPVLLFGDNFNVLGASDDINPGSNDQARRQSGTIAPLNYLEHTGKTSESTRLGDPRARNGLLLSSDAQPRTSVSPAADFSSAGPGPHRYTIEFMVNPGRSTAHPEALTPEWAGVLFGVSEQMATMPEATSGIGFLIRGNGGFTVFDSTSGETKAIREGSIQEALSGGDLAGWYKLRVVYDVPAHDGKSPCQVRIAVNDRTLLSFQTEAGIAHNFVILDANSYADVYHAFDDLKITHEMISISAESPP